VAEPIAFTMPSLGADMDAGTLVEWKVRPGDVVRRGQVVAVVETHKGAIDVEIWHDGTIVELKVGLDEKVPVGTVLATLSPTSSAQPVPAPQPVPVPAPQPVPVPVPVPQLALAPAARPEQAEARAEAEAGAREEWIRSSPAARRRAHELGVPLSAVRGTGPHGAVTRADIERHAAAPPPPPPPAATSAEPKAPTVPPKGRSDAAKLAMRQAIAAAMERSNRDIPHYYLQHHVDVKAALDHVAKLNRERPIEGRILPMALFLRAIGLAFAKHRELNGFWVDGAFRPAEGVHPGVAIALRGGGLVIPALHDVDRRSIDQIMADLTDLTARARAARLRSSELADGTATVTGLGDQGVETVFGVVYPPQVALVGLGKVLDRPWAVDGMLAVRPVLSLTLAADHRATDGHLGSLFLSTLARLLAAPETL
jgi:pyruvate dehydrogenase E2 component (dihydrolipoamide acetyltransferase)